MPVFEHTATYPYPRDHVWAWHERPGAFVRLTPPGMATAEGEDAGLTPGSVITLHVSHPVVSGAAGMLGLRVRPHVGWTLRHFGLVPGERFIDEQLKGPFRSWRHEHLFADAPGGGTTITDRVTWEFPAPRSLVESQLVRFFRFREAQLRDDLAFHAGHAAGEARHVAVAGASGLIGTQLCALLTTGGHRVTRLVRGRGTPDERPRDGEIVWDPGQADTGAGGRPGRLEPSALADVDVVINLAGSPIARRFSRTGKQQLHHSRVRATRTIAQALAEVGDGRGRTLVQGSAVGYYGARRPGEILTEDAAAGSGFLADVVQHWEGAARPAEDAGLRVAYLRTGTVLAESGGMLLPQLASFGVGLGGPLTEPDAYLSWIALDDAVRGFAHAALAPDASGPLNLTSPEPVTQAEFAAELGRTLHRPSAVPLPSWAPSAVLGRGATDQIVRTDQRVHTRLPETGFEFAYPELGRALRHVLRR
ncbi:TIGR01777 family oxidoreductase [Nigerium massiliense]|uniref:TIGR01777 family oxidoreductase n=1 Tax=Nigerium massiliense TaxID=1522317 RepID=UPI00058FC53D|nr:TIGR01777 family oxidoreductase [Nigerium massiliense]